MACRMLAMLKNVDNVCFVTGHFSSKETALCEQGINDYHRLEFSLVWNMYTSGDKWGRNAVVAVNRVSIHGHRSILLTWVSWRTIH